MKFAKRIFAYKPPKVKFDNPNSIYSFMCLEIANKTHEEFFVLYLDKRLHLIKKDLITVGTMDLVVFDIKEIFKRALKYGSSNLILIHNHPSGYLVPSQSDVDATVKAVAAGNSLDINVIDHIIISNEGYYSFLENHKMP